MGHFEFALLALLLVAVLATCSDVLTQSMMQLSVPNKLRGRAMGSWILAVVGPGKRGYGVGLVTTAMFLGQFLTPIVAEPLIDPNDPGTVWKSVSAMLLCLAVLYGVLAKVGGEPKPLGQLAVDDGTGLRTSDVTR